MIGDINIDRCLVVTFNDTVLTNQSVDLTDFVPCTIEEADKSIFIHAENVAQSNIKILVKTVWCSGYCCGISMTSYT